jgi:hypothetical protein
MSANEGHPIIAEQGILHVPGNYQPIHLEDTVGAVFLGILALILLIGWIRSEARYRKLRMASEMNVGNRMLDHR